MMRIQGTILSVDELTREIVIATRKRHWHVVVQRSAFNQYYNFLEPGHTIVGDIKVTRVLRPPIPKLRVTLTHIFQIHRPHPRGRLVFYSHHHVQKQTGRFINKLGMKLFLDLEMSMHPYKIDKQFVQEVIQAGYVLTDAEGNVVKRYSAFIRPTRHRKLTHRTLKFLDLTQADVDSGIPYTDFHQHLHALIDAYHPAIIVWGMNDAIALREGADINSLPRLPKRTRFVNLLKLHKNYFGLKDDLGLANAFKLYGHQIDSQRHDALEDAEMTRLIFEGFQGHMNGTVSIDRTILNKVK
ncbi:MAG: hypothetical protein EA374_01160 [Acholeplasmatales bacterium]|nr:MAG: hypothetical protein EA374_01160 [Acholeplasmatales bacterium]